MTKHWRPGLRVYWREPGCSQIGLDPRCAALVDGLNANEQALLEHLPDCGTDDDLFRYAHSIGIPRAPVLALLERIEAGGYFTDDAPMVDTADIRYWHHAELAGTPRPLARRSASVRIVGVDALGLRIARVLAEAGVGTVILDDRRPVAVTDIAGDGFRPLDVGHRRDERAISYVRATSPMTSVTRRTAEPEDLVVLVEHGAADPVRSRPLMREDQTHLAVLVRELDIVVGPLVRPGVGACLRCLDLARCEQDPRWPALATQVTAVPPQGTETSLAWSGAALAAHQALAALDGRSVLVEGVTLEVSATYPLPRYREWSLHPDCGCAALSLVDSH